MKRQRLKKTRLAMAFLLAASMGYAICVSAATVTTPATSSVKAPAKETLETTRKLLAERH